MLGVARLAFVYTIVYTIVGILLRSIGNRYSRYAGYGVAGAMCGERKSGAAAKLW